MKKLLIEQSINLLILGCKTLFPSKTYVFDLFHTEKIKFQKLPRKQKNFEMQNKHE